jgi:hypothetical protein
MNLIVTLSHIAIIVAYTLVLFINDNFFFKLPQNTYWRVNTYVYFISGLLDIFVSYMVWFIISEESPTLIRDESNHISYPVLDVIRVRTKDESLYI